MNEKSLIDLTRVPLCMEYVLSISEDEKVTFRGQPFYTRDIDRIAEKREPLVADVYYYVVEQFISRNQDNIAGMEHKGPQDIRWTNDKNVSHSVKFILYAVLDGNYHRVPYSHSLIQAVEIKMY